MPNQPAIILLAEDSADDAVLIKRALKEVTRDVKLRHVRDGTECIRYLAGEDPYDDRETFPFPAFLLLDLKMPGEDGFDVLRWLKQHPEIRLPVIVLTGSIAERDRTESLNLGAREFHQKPAGYDDTVALAAAICQRWFGSGSAAAS